MRPRGPVLRASSKVEGEAGFIKAKGLLMRPIGGLPMMFQGPKVLVVWVLLMYVRSVVRVMVARA